jgi:iron(III) transport system ATP-binding protein
MWAQRCWQIVGEHLKHRSSAAVFTTHDPDAVLRYAKNVICLEKAAVTFCGSVETLYLDPPSKELAWLLGPCNWLGKADYEGDRDGLDRADGEFCCVRPSQMKLEKDSSGRFVVETILRAASVIELRLRNRHSELQTEIFVLQLGDDVGVGDAVRINVRPSGTW